MRIRTVAIAKDTDLRNYLLEAERTIDALSDDELDHFERELQASIQKLVPTKPILKLVGDEDRAPQKPKPKPKKIPDMIWPAFTGLLVAALALIIIQKPDQTQDTSQWQTKGTGATTLACSITIQQASLGSAELTDAGYIVKKSAPVYLKTNCKNNITLQVLENGIWQSRGSFENQSGFLASRGELANLSGFVGKSLRLQSEEGLSEEFILNEVR